MAAAPPAARGGSSPGLRGTSVCGLPAALVAQCAAGRAAVPTPLRWELPPRGPRHATARTCAPDVPLVTTDKTRTAPPVTVT